MRVPAGPPRAAALAGVLAAALLAGGSAAKGETIEFTLQGVAFDDGGTASGGFVVNAATGTVQSVDLVTTAGSRLGGTTYTQVTQQPSYFADTPYSFLSQNGNYISLSFQHALTTAGADPIVTTVGQFGIGESYECDNCATYRVVTDGQAFGLAVGGPDRVVTGDPIGVPEPISLAAFGTSLLGLGLARAASKR